VQETVTRSPVDTVGETTPEIVNWQVELKLGLILLGLLMYDVDDGNE
jgi:hypothetical protein